MTIGRFFQLHREGRLIIQPDHLPGQRPDENTVRVTDPDNPTDSMVICRRASPAEVNAIFHLAQEALTQDE